MRNWFVYVIINKAKDYKYIGISQDLNKRLKQHNAGVTQSTKPHRPFERIIQLAECSTAVEARKQEKYFKSGIGRKHIKNLILSIGE